MKRNASQLIPYPLQAILACGLLLGCEKTPLSTGVPEDTSCSDCHGNQINAAPPESMDGDTDPANVGVGAHQQHLIGNVVFPAVPCEECHVVPEAVEDEGHADPLPAEVTFGALAGTDGATPSWDREAETCQGTYCHGATLSGGSLTEPKWTIVDGTQVICGTCHGFPPPAPHAQSSNCDQCHAAMAVGLHINGVLDMGEAGCSACHGGADNAAPPVDLNGNSDTTLVSVGAHQSHLAASTWRAPIACDECHVEPSSVGDPGHNDGTTQLTWGSLATADGASPSFDGTGETCSGVYCHGSTLMPGGTITVPSWTTVDDSQAACGSCHSLPPGGTHPPDSVGSCGCHGTVWDGSGFVDPDSHINGSVQF